MEQCSGPVELYNLSKERMALLERMNLLEVRLTCFRCILRRRETKDYVFCCIIYLGYI